MFPIKNFYPTPPHIIGKMISKITKSPKKILEPQAGKGDIVDALLKKYDHHRHGYVDISCIEIDPNLQSILRDRKHKLIDQDFLSFAGPDKFDLIIANPPFDEGEKHLLKAIDIMYTGEIIFLLHAETLKNPYSLKRKDLVRKLDELGASVDYIANGFLDAERKTAVEVALIHISIDREIETDLFDGADDWAPDSKEKFREKHEVATGRTIDDLVAEYDETIRVGTETILGYYRNYRKIGAYIRLNNFDNKISYSADSLTKLVQEAMNDLLKSVRVTFWRRTLDLKEVRARLTEKKQAEFEHKLTDRTNMDFTAANIRQFVLNIIGGYEQTMAEAVVDTFDKFTLRHCHDDGIDTGNIHYFSGWKTNKAFACNHRVVVPIRASYGPPFRGYSGWELDYQAAYQIDDIDKVMNMLSGKIYGHKSMCDAIREAFKKDQSSGIESTHFMITCHRKGTMHIKFKDLDLLRRFNLVACREKNMLPFDYGKKSYSDMSTEEREVVMSFEGSASYIKNEGQPLFGNETSSTPQIELFDFLKAA